MNLFKRNKKNTKLEQPGSMQSLQEIGLEMVTSNIEILRQALVDNLDQLPDPEVKRHTLGLLDEALEVLTHGSLTDKVALVSSPEFAKWLGFPLQNKNTRTGRVRKR